MDEIEKKIETILNMFEINDDGTVELLSNLQVPLISEEDILAVFKHIFAVSKKMIPNLIAEVDYLREEPDHEHLGY